MWNGKPNIAFAGNYFVIKILMPPLGIPFPSQFLPPRNRPAHPLLSKHVRYLSFFLNFLSLTSFPCFMKLSNTFLSIHLFNFFATSNRSAAVISSASMVPAFLSIHLFNLFATSNRSTAVFLSILPSSALFLPPKFLRCSFQPAFDKEHHSQPASDNETQPAFRAKQNKDGWKPGTKLG
uniref:Uncharacterized protein LOC105049022 isoform X2 n=1 Tax=Elaeis guineensis var. tenera TaxID=51953 RepID=A0A6J0PK50_ELAGV|nr:uncharacterized protein LOC105049022 isoform X2 [Elaeis guineensis]